mmetsp:Transcript_68746/g.182848  ORF Transcript_68746/g.182848 Transcript_68746/m.182848 type:complete len:265 (-) Transcript_68746:758-1552(-)
MLGPSARPPVPMSGRRRRRRQWLRVPPQMPVPPCQRRRQLGGRGQPGRGWCCWWACLAAGRAPSRSSSRSRAGAGSGSARMRCRAAAPWRTRSEGSRRMRRTRSSSTGATRGPRTAKPSWSWPSTPRTQCACTLTHPPRSVRSAWPSGRTTRRSSLGVAGMPSGASTKASRSRAARKASQRSSPWAASRMRITCSPAGVRSRPRLCPWASSSFPRPRTCLTSRMAASWPKATDSCSRSRRRASSMAAQLSSWRRRLMVQTAASP